MEKPSCSYLFLFLLLPTFLENISSVLHSLPTGGFLKEWSYTFLFPSWLFKIDREVKVGVCITTSLVDI